MKKLENVKILFYNNYWDGPICGICEYENKMYYYDMIEEGGIFVEEGEEYDEDGEDIWTPRIYEIKEIEPWQLTYELYWHSIFATNVGTNTEFDKGLVNERFKIKKSWFSSLPSYYKKQKKERKDIDYSKNKIIGIFER